MKEIWKDVKGFEGRYKISNYGELMSFPSKGLYKNTWHILSNVNKKGGYLSVVLKYKDKIRYTRIHILVYEAHIKEIPKYSKYHIHHINNNKQDNRVDNLILLTPTQHYYADLDRRNTKAMNDYNKYIRPKKIIQMTLTGKIIATYNNSQEASFNTGVCQRNILQVAAKTPYNKKGYTRKQAGGYIYGSLPINMQWKWFNREQLYNML